MPTIARGNTAEIYCPLATSVTFTPGSGGAVRVSVSAQSGDPAIAPQFIQSATAVAVTAGATVFAEAVTADANYTESVATAVASLVSEDRITTWANRAALVTAGLTTALFTDVGIGGTYFDYIGGRWRAQTRRHTQKNLVTSVSNNGAPKVVMDYALLQAGLVQDGDILVIKYLKERTGGTSDTDATDILLGTSPTVLGTSFGLSTSALATTALQLSPAELWMRRESATSLRPISVGGAAGSGTNNGANTAVTVPNMDSQDTYLQISSDLTTAGGEVAWLRGFIVEIMAGA